MPEFICNICGKKSGWTGAKLERERSSCLSCGSSVRTRSLVHALSRELFGASLPLPDFPRVKSLRGLGISDPDQYAGLLAHKFDYRNTFFDRPPLLDITQPAGRDEGLYDFIIASEVFEHTAPPAEKAFRGAAALLNDRGVLLMTVPYQIDAPQAEHFPELHQFGLVNIGGKTALVNRSQDGRTQVFENLVFHSSFGQPALEMREFSEEGLRSLFAAAGFIDVRFYAEDHLPFGIAHAESWSLPVAARRGPFAFSMESAREIVEQWRDVRQKLDSEMDRFNRSLWFRAGRKLGLF